MAAYFALHCMIVEVRAHLQYFHAKSVVPIGHGLRIQIVLMRFCIRSNQNRTLLKTSRMMQLFQSLWFALCRIKEIQLYNALSYPLCDRDL